MEPGDIRKNGRKVVLAGGTFDILHPGHVFFLEKAREFGDCLIVVVARDSTVRRLKGEPIIPEKQRLLVVSSLKPVDNAVLGYESRDFSDIVLDIKPDVIVLGPNQVHEVSSLREEMKRAGLDVEITRLDERLKGPLYSTKRIIDKIKKS